MRKITKTQTDTATWVASTSDIATDLEKTGLITRIDVQADITPSAAMTGAFQPDSPWRVIQNLKIEGGAHQYVSLPGDAAGPGGILLHYLNAVDFRNMSGVGQATLAAPLHTYVPITFCLHFGSRPQDPFGRDNPFDLSGFIPAHAESQLRALWTTGANTTMDDTVTLSSGTMRFTLNVVQGSDAEIRGEMARQGVQAAMVPAWVSKNFAHTATASDYSEELDVPTGGFLKRIAILEKDATGTRDLRAADEVTGVALKLPLQNETLFQELVDNWVNHLPAASASIADVSETVWSGFAAPHGILIKDLRPYGHPDYGLDMRRMTTGAVKLGFTISVYTSGDDSLILYERMQAYGGQLAPI